MTSERWDLLERRLKTEREKVDSKLLMALRVRGNCEEVRNLCRDKFNVIDNANTTPWRDNIELVVNALVVGEWKDRIVVRGLFGRKKIEHSPYAREFQDYTKRELLIKKNISEKDYEAILSREGDYDALSQYFHERGVQERKELMKRNYIVPSNSLKRELNYWGFDLK